MNIFTLAIIVNSFVEMDVINPSLLNITKEKILALPFDDSTEGDNFRNKEGLRPLDCALYMTAFCRAGMFNEMKLLEKLESIWLNSIEEADG